MKRTNYARQVLKFLEDLDKKYPNQSLGTHFSLAFADYGDTWGMSNKEMLFVLQKYEVQLELDFIPESDKSLEKIIEEGKNLDTLFDEEDENDY